MFFVAAKITFKVVPIANEQIPLGMACIAF
jgi:hypothetical protein